MNRQELAREYCYEKIGGTSGQDSFDYTYDGFIAGFDKALELIEEWTCNKKNYFRVYDEYKGYAILRQIDILNKLKEMRGE